MIFSGLFRRRAPPELPLPPIPPGAPPVPELTEATLDTWLSALRPSPADLAWRAIPWRPTLWQAAVDARRERKPLALLVMNGHPLGAT